MKSEIRSAAWNCVGWAGLALLLLVWVELALPVARRLLASVLPLQVFVCLIVSSGCCIAAGVLKKKWFLVPGILAVASVVLLLVSVFAE
jgi:hypothetical protein